MVRSDAACIDKRCDDPGGAQKGNEDDGDLEACIRTHAMRPVIIDRAIWESSSVFCIP